MRSEEISLRQLFDEIVELPFVLRDARISALDVREGIRTDLRMMVAFDELMQHAPEQRTHELASLNVTDSDRVRLQNMLTADAKVPELLQATAAEASLRLAGDDELGNSLVGTSIGTFRLLALIGQGGSSVVFRAERAAGDGSQLVALKLLRTGLYSTDAQRRFRREQAILAQLTHPNIAGLIEGGVSDAGIPYIAMELVEGVPITRAADAQALSIEQRLILFCTLCRTVEAAHAALVVHRDLKPSNLLITSAGDLKVLDFGIARLVDDDDPTTHTHSVALTPEYAAPEQYRAGPLTTAVDIYALGVLLGELLTGKRLTVNARASSLVAGMKDSVMPSGLPPPRELVRRLRGDLDSILSIALADEPALRYRSANAFADDIERHLAGRPVRAHPPSHWYRMRKFVARHRIGFSVTAVLLCGMFGASGLAVWQGMKARHAADAAQAQAARADSMRNFMFNAFAEAEPAKPRNGPANIVEVVDRAIATATSDRSIDPRARIELLARLAEVLGAQGNVERSGKLLASAGEQVEAMLGKEDLLAFEVRRLIEHNHFLRGSYSIARTEVDALLDSVPASLVELRCKLLRDSSVLASFMRDPNRAIADGRRAVEIAHQSGDAELQRTTLSTLGATLVGAGKLSEAITVIETVETLNRARFGDESVEVSDTWSGLSRAYRRLGDLGKAEAYARLSVDTDRKIYPGDHMNMANHLNALGVALKEKRDFAGALEAFRESLRIYEATVGEDHPDTSIALQSVAFVEVQLEDYAHAIPRLRRAMAASSQKFGEHSSQANWDRADYGYALALQGDCRVGVDEIDRAIGGFQKLSPPDWDILGRAVEKRVRASIECHDAASATQRIAQLAEVSGRVTEQAAYWVGRSECLRGETLLALGHASQAAAALAECAVKLDSAKEPEAVLYAAQPLLQSAAFLASGDSPKARAFATLGRQRLLHLSSPPSRLLKLESTLPR